jgi:DNA-damage-inducible protein J
MRTALIQTRVEPELKRDAEALFSGLGMDTPTAIRVFLSQAVRVRGLPFDVRQQERFNPVTIAAIAEAAAIEPGDTSVQTYKSWAALEASLDEVDE